MAGRTPLKISAASARTHTRKPIFSGMLKKTVLASFVGLSGWVYKVTKPPSPKICGSTNGPPITAPRIQLKDGRHLAYKEFGVPKDIANHKIVFIHGFDSCRHDVGVITANLSPNIVESKGIYIVSFDRPGYGESDPNPNRTPKSLTCDIEELADQLGLGAKFYVVGYSMGGQVAWACLKYIPHRLAGAALLAPVVNYWWPGFPSDVSQQAYKQQATADQWTLRVARHMPWLTYWWNTQKLFPSSSVIAQNPALLSKPDLELIMKAGSKRMNYQAMVRQQGVFESIHRDLIVGFGASEFDPMDLKNPFLKGEGSVHLWQGDDDRLVPVSLQRYIADKLSWVQYHEVPGAGHFFPSLDGMADNIIQQLIA